MLVICIVDFEALVIPDDITNDSQFKETIISYAKKELKELRQIDNVIGELLRSEDFNFQKGLGIFVVQFLEKLDSFELEFRGQSFIINRKNIEKLIQGYRILNVVECTIFIPVLSSPKWVKGLIREKDFELQIFAPGFELDDEKFCLEVIKYNSDLRKTLEKMAQGRMLLLYSSYSHLIE